MRSSVSFCRFIYISSVVNTRNGLCESSITGWRRKCRLCNRQANQTRKTAPVECNVSICRDCDEKKGIATSCLSITPDYHTGASVIGLETALFDAVAHPLLASRYPVHSARAGRDIVGREGLPLKRLG